MRKYLRFFTVMLIGSTVGLIIGDRLAEGIMF